MARNKNLKRRAPKLIGYPIEMDSESIALTSSSTGLSLEEFAKFASEELTNGQPKETVSLPEIIEAASRLNIDFYVDVLPPERLGIKILELDEVAYARISSADAYKIYREPRDFNTADLQFFYPDCLPEFALLINKMTHFDFSAEILTIKKSEESELLNSIAKKKKNLRGRPASKGVDALEKRLEQFLKASNIELFLMPRSKSNLKVNRSKVYEAFKEALETDERLKEKNRFRLPEKNYFISHYRAFIENTVAKIKGTPK